MKELVRTGKNDLNTGEVWACTTCAACMERCPVFNEHIPVIVEMRRRLLADGSISEGVAQALTNLSRYGNSFGRSPRTRPKWVQQLDFAVKDARKETVEYLWLVGDYASFDARAIPATCATARILKRARIDFGILYEAEQNSGNDVRRVGEEGLFEALAEGNRTALGKARFEKILTTDPHTYHTLKNEYPWPNGRPQVFHITELISRLLRATRLPVWGELNATVTYHDPCYLGRYNEVYAAPRHILNEIGAHLVEMPRNRASSYCCGAGGGRIWMKDEAGPNERPAEERVREAAALRGVTAIAVACPKDMVMFQDAIKTTGLDQRMAVKDIVELVDEATCPIWSRSHE
jgi:Fe-S oxidoreductase